MQEILSVSIPAHAWTDAERDGSRLVSTLVVDGCSLHLEALAVEQCGDIQCYGTHDEEATALRAAYGADGPWQTVLVGGREYVLIASPYCE